MTNKEIWEEYPEIYHYTKFDTVLLILHSAKLRATRFDLLNDTQEIIYAENILAERLHDKNGITIEKAKCHLKKLFEAMGRELFITSFCGKNSKTNPYHRNNGLLSMWRNYGADGGCAIVFHTQNIFKNTTKYNNSLNLATALVMDKVVYRGQNDDDENYCDRLDRFVFNDSEFSKKPETFNRMDEFIEDLLSLMFISKHPAFFEELEVRLGLCFKKPEGEDKPFSPHEYHEIPFSPDKDISRIIIGPHRDQQGRFDFLKSYLSKSGLNNIEVSKSEIPLRF